MDCVMSYLVVRVCRVKCYVDFSNAVHFHFYKNTGANILSSTNIRSIWAKVVDFKQNLTMSR